MLKFTIDIKTSILYNKFEWKISYTIKTYWKIE